jgi:hypothetical protein
LTDNDLVLAKIVRNNDRDRADVAAIAEGHGLDIDLLCARYDEELRPKALQTGAGRFHLDTLD